MNIQCSCGKLLEVEDRHAESQLTCPECLGRVKIPQPEHDWTNDIELVNDHENAPAAGQEPGQGEPETEISPRRTGPVQSVLADAPKKKKKKTPKPAIREESGIAGRSRAEARAREEKERAPYYHRPLFGWPGWVWGSVLGGVGVVGSGIALGIIAATDSPSDALRMATALAVSVPVGLIILAVSIFISNMIGAGIEVGDLRATIPMVIGLLCVSTMIIFIMPFLGWFIGIPVWWLGLMRIFHLDLWETRVLFIINWGCQRIVKLLIVAIVISGTSKKAAEVPSHDSGNAPQMQTKRDDLSSHIDESKPPPAAQPGRRR